MLEFEMNERIGELYTEALKYADSRVPAEHRYNDIYYAIVSGKHAELIVRECVNVAKQTDSYDDDVYKSGRTWAGIDILKHFGVES